MNLLSNIRKVLCIKKEVNVQIPEVLLQAEDLDLEVYFLGKLRDPEAPLVEPDGKKGLLPPEVAQKIGSILHYDGLPLDAEAILDGLAAQDV